MNQAPLYHTANQVQRHDAEQIVKEYKQKIQWCLNGTLLDVGTGTGDVLMDFIYPTLPKKFEKVVGTDVSLKMVNYARNLYSKQFKCDFRQLDIGTEEDLPNDLKEQFDHVTSFYCLHWVQNQRQALHNIFQLLRAEAGGDCLLVFLATNPIYDVYKLLCKTSKWSPYMKDVDKFISPLHFCSDPKLKISTMLKEVGFIDIDVEIRQNEYNYEGQKIFEDNVKAVCPFFERIPLNLHENFTKDFVNTATNMGLRRTHDSDYIFSIPYKLAIVYAKKPSNINSGIISEMISSSKVKKGIV